MPKSGHSQPYPRRTPFGVRESASGPAVASSLAAALLALVPSPSGSQPGTQASSSSATETCCPTFAVPPVDLGERSLDRRREAQLEEAAEFAVRHDFSFRDSLEASGITFEHRPTADSGATYRPVHYDHGNGVSAADVDGDGLLDLYFTNQIGANELWRNLGDGRFEEISRRSPGLGLADRVSVAGSFADIDNDGDPDLYVTAVRSGNKLFRNEGGGRFVDITERSGLGHQGHSSGAVFFDFDNDGLLDLFLTNVGEYTVDELDPSGYYIGRSDAFSGHHHPGRAERSLLFRNLDGERFREVGLDMGLDERGWAGDASFADLNRDGYLDLYVLNMQGDDHYWENREGKGFVERTSDYFPKTPWGAMGIKFFDLENDGDEDLLLTDMHSDMSYEVPPAVERAKSVPSWSDEELQGGDNNIFGNALYRNGGEGPFSEVSDAYGAENYWPWGVSVGDLNADGYEDVIITSSMNYPFRYAINSLLLNEGGERFRHAEFVLGIEPRRGGEVRKPLFDIECPPGPDVHEALSPAVQEMYRLCSQRQGTHTVLGTVGTRGAVFLDLEGDGDLDIVTAEFGSAPQVLVSDLSERGALHWVSLQLVGSKSNRDGLGARVEVHAGDDVFVRRVDGKSGYLSQSSMPLYVGLGPHRAVDRVVVEWPAGARPTPGRLGVGKVRPIAESP